MKYNFNRKNHNSSPNNKDTKDEFANDDGVMNRNKLKNKDQNVVSPNNESMSDHLKVTINPIPLAI